MSSYCAKILSPKNYKPKLWAHKSCAKNFRTKNLLSNGLVKLIPGVQHESRQDRQTGSWPSDRKHKTGNGSSHRRPPGFSRRNSRSNYHHCFQQSFIKLLTTAVSWNWAGSAISNGREPRSCLGWVFNIKLGSLVSKQLNCMAHTHSHFWSWKLGLGFVLLADVCPWIGFSVSNWQKVQLNTDLLKQRHVYLYTTLKLNWNEMKLMPHLSWRELYNLRLAEEEIKECFYVWSF